jgi:hypothetical protein
MFNPENLFPEDTVFNCSRNCSSECFFDEKCPDTAKREEEEKQAAGEKPVSK